MYVGHKHAETGPNYSHELATFLKYHMPLRIFRTLDIYKDDVQSSNFNHTKKKIILKEHV